MVGLVLGKVTGSGGWINTIENLDKKIKKNELEEEDLPLETKEFLALLEAMVLSIREMQKTVEKCKIGSFDEAFKQYRTIKRDQHGNQQHYEEQHAAMKFKIQQHGNQKRTDMQ
jgi:hypothetical protein